MSIVSEPKVQPGHTGSESREKDRGWLVTAFDNSDNTYEEVMTILMIATACDVDEAFCETWEIDNLGRSVVHISNADDCERVAQVIRKIGMRVEVSEDL